MSGGRKIKESIFTDLKDTIDSASVFYDKVNWSINVPKVYAARSFDYVPSFDSISQQPILYPLAVPNSEMYRTYYLNSSYLSSISFNGKTLESLMIELNDSTLPNGYWKADLKEDINGRIALGNVSIEYVMDYYDDSQTKLPFGHLDTDPTCTHNVLESLEFKNIIATLEFKDTANNNSEFKLYFDADSNAIGQNTKKIPLPIESFKNVRRTADKNGTYDGKDNCQIGLKKSLIYCFKISDRLLWFTIEMSFVFMYPYADFDPLGTVLANKIYPQIAFDSYFETKEQYEARKIQADLKYPGLMPNWDNWTGVIDLDTDLQALNANFETVVVKSYSSRTKMIVNNDSSHHVSPSTNAYPDGFKRDENYLYRFRKKVNDYTKIPPIFEKIITDDYIQGGKVKGNIVGFYADSNKGTLQPHKVDDGRKLTTYQFDPAYAPDFLGKSPSPFWQNIFDYASYGLETEKEFIAVYGNNSDELDPSNFGKFKNERKDENFNYPLSSSNTKLTLDKIDRQGYYDNLHLHGYLGHYLDNQKLVVHAPICGYCCFHLHWRWSKLNYEISNSNLFKGSSNGTLDQFDIEEENYLGWSDYESQSDSKNSFVKASGAGRVLIPPNQQLKIAVTHPNKSPIDEEYNVIGNTTEKLDLERKCIWYSVNINNLDKNGKHSSSTKVVMEQGCGYAVDYSDNAKENIEGDFTGGMLGYLTAFSRKEFEDTVKEILKKLNGGIEDARYEDFVHFFNNENPWFFDGAEFPFPDLYEVLYRMMHFFNTDSNGTDFKHYDQIPTNNSGDDNTPYFDLKKMEKQ
jgi:hypothetical protein